MLQNGTASLKKKIEGAGASCWSASAHSVEANLLDPSHSRTAMTSRRSPTKKSYRISKLIVVKVR